MYQLKTALFENGYSEEFILFQQDYNMPVESSGTLTSGAKI